MLNHARKRWAVLLTLVLLLSLGAVVTTPTALRFLAFWGARAATSLTSSDLDGRTFDEGGVRLRYVVEGTGEPVVLAHGFASNLEANWLRTRVIDGLVGSGFQVIAYDARGHGGSEKPHEPANYGAEDVRDIVRLLDHLGIGQAHLVGYSRGAMLSHYARQWHAERFLTVTLGGYGSTGEGTGPIESLPAHEVAGSLERGRLGPLARALVLEGEAPPSARELAIAEGFIGGTNDMQALAAIFRAPPLSPIPLSAFRERPVPTLALVGEHDPMRRQAERMAQAVGDLELRIIKNADHLSAPAAEEFVEELIGFLNRHRSGKGQ